MTDIQERVREASNMIWNFGKKITHNQLDEIIENAIYLSVEAKSKNHCSCVFKNSKKGTVEIIKKRCKYHGDLLDKVVEAKEKEIREEAKLEERIKIAKNIISASEATGRTIITLDGFLAWADRNASPKKEESNE